MNNGDSKFIKKFLATDLVLFCSVLIVYSNTDAFNLGGGEISISDG